MWYEIKSPNRNINIYYITIVIAIATFNSSKIICLFTTLDRNSQVSIGQINEDINFMSFLGALATFSTSLLQETINSNQCYDPSPESSQQQF